MEGVKAVSKVNSIAQKGQLGYFNIWGQPLNIYINSHSQFFLYHLGSNTAWMVDLSSQRLLTFTLSPEGIERQEVPFRKATDLE